MFNGFTNITQPSLNGLQNIDADTITTTDLQSDDIKTTKLVVNSVDIGNQVSENKTNLTGITYTSTPTPTTNISNKLFINNLLNVMLSSTFNDSCQFDKFANFSESIRVNASSQFDSSLNILGDANINGFLNVTSNATFNSNLTLGYNNNIFIVTSVMMMHRSASVYCVSVRRGIGSYTSN